MGHGKVIIFDLFDTIIKDVSYEYSKGLDYLKNEILIKSCDPKEVKHIAEQFKKKMRTMFDTKYFLIATIGGTTCSRHRSQ